MRQSVQVDGVGGVFCGLIMDTDERTGIVWVEERLDDAARRATVSALLAGEPILVTARVRAASMLKIIRALQQWPIDLLEEMAAADEREHKS